jgi:hypothetical protein
MFKAIFSKKGSSSDSASASKPKLNIVDVLLIPATEDSDSKTWVLASKRSKLYVAATRGTLPASALESVDSSAWSFVRPQKLDPANLYTIDKPSYHRFRYRKGEAHNDVYKEHHNSLEVATSHKGLEQLEDEHTALLTRREVVTCELLRENPHHNIAEYRGVICSDELEFDHPSGLIHVPFDAERILKLVFKRYDCTLWDLVVHQQSVNVEQCLQSVAAGISHMHSLGLVHGDIKPKNIFLSAEDGKDPEQSLHYVIADFDSTHKAHSRIMLKSGELTWTRPKHDGDYAEEDDDWYAFYQVKMWLVESTGTRMSEFEGIGKRVGESVRRR